MDGKKDTEKERNRGGRLRERQSVGMGKRWIYKKIVNKTGYRKTDRQKYRQEFRQTRTQTNDKQDDRQTDSRK